MHNWNSKFLTTLAIKCDIWCHLLQKWKTIPLLRRKAGLEKRVTSPQTWFMLLMPFPKEGKLSTTFTAVPDSCLTDGLHGRLFFCSPICLHNIDVKVAKTSKPMMSMRTGGRYEWKHPYSGNHQPTLHWYQSPRCPQKSHDSLLMHLQWMLKYQLAVWSKFCWFRTIDTFSSSTGSLLVSSSKDVRL